MINFRLAQKEDLKPLANIYKGLYYNSILNENWSEDTAYKLLNFFYTLQPDIFVVAEENSKVVGAIMSLVKPWHDGNRLIETEIFVAKNYQHKCIGSKLFQEHFKKAIEKYDVKVIEAHTYQEQDGYPLNWYKKQGYEIINNWYVINGNIKQAYEYLNKKIKE
jgi:ribosomal protein S18 acetylase RimI-like enzyme